MNNTLSIWKYLIRNNYFEKHKLYDFTPVIPNTIEYNDIKDKIVVEIGCGYGRETWYIASLAKKVYAIDVSSNILDKAKKFITKQNGHTDNIEFLTAEEYKDKIPNNVNFVYSRLVFQHITPIQSKDYIDTFYNKLNYDGKILIQFRLGSTKGACRNKEPNFQYSLEEVRDFFNKADLDIIKEEIKNNKHLYMTVKKELDSIRFIAKKRDKIEEDNNKLLIHDEHILSDLEEEEVPIVKREKILHKVVYVVGGGSSLEDFDFYKIMNKDTIAINKAILYVPKSNYFITMDYTFLDRISRKTHNALSKARFAKQRCKKYFVVAGDNDYLVKEGENYIDKRWNYVYHLESFNEVIYSKKNSGFGMTIDDFRHGCSSGYCGIQLAIIMGYEEIYLMGFDLNVNDNKTHFHLGYGMSAYEFQKKLNFYAGYFEKGLKQIRRTHPEIKIISCSPISRLNKIIPYEEIK